MLAHLLPPSLQSGGPDRIEPVLNLPPPNAGALELGNIKKYETDLAKQKIDADKAKAIIEDHLGPNMSAII